MIKLIIVAKICEVLFQLQIWQLGRTGYIAHRAVGGG